jgi:hypothetical protein
MDSKFSDLNEQLRNELIALWKSGIFDKMAAIVESYFPALKKDKRAFSLEFDVSYSSINLGDETRSRVPLAVLATSFSFPEDPSKKMFDILESENLSSDEKKLRELYKKGAQDPVYKIRFVPIVSRGKEKRCESCGGTGHARE